MILFVMAVSIFTSWITFYLIKNPSITPTRGSATVAFVGVGVIYLLNHFILIDVQFYSLLVFGASFVGMCSSKKVSDSTVLLGGLIFSVLFLYLVPMISNYGGALGFSAFISVLIAKLSFGLKNYVS